MGLLFGCTRISIKLKLKMNTFIVFTTLMAAACAAPQSLVRTVNEGEQTGPLTPLIGNLVQTPKGLRPTDLEGFSEDLDQDGFVDPIVPAPIVRQVVAAPAPIVQPQVVAAPAPIVRQVVAAPAPAPIVRQVVAAPAPIVRQVVAAPAPIVKTIAPVGIPV